MTQTQQQHRWTIGSCEPNDTTIQIRKIPGDEENDEEQANIQFEILLKSSKSVVLFRADDEKILVPIRIQSRNVLDTALIFEACQQYRNADEKSETESTISIPVNRVEMQDRVSNGDVPMIPPSRPWIQQFLLKRSMDLIFHRPTVEFFAAGPHRLTSLCYFNVHQYPAVRGHVALSLDDAPGRLGPQNSRLDEIRNLLAESENAKATFMVVEKFIQGQEKNLIQLLRDGHELGNHGSMDQAHAKLSDEEFLEAVDRCSDRIRSLQGQAGIPEGVRYFRAPHASYTKRMEQLIQSRHMVNVMCDAYASDPIVEDGEYIAKSLLRQSRDGGIILLHIPEIGFRDHCMVALRQLLRGLRQRKLKVVTVGMLETLAKGSFRG